MNACEVFVYTENLLPKAEDDKGIEGLAAAEWTKKAARAIEMSAQHDGWAFLGAVGSYLRQLDPAFDLRSHRHKRLSLLIKSRPDLFEMRESNPNGGPSVVYVRLRSRRKITQVALVPSSWLTPLEQLKFPCTNMRHLRTSVLHGFSGSTVRTTVPADPPTVSAAGPVCPRSGPDPAAGINRANREVSVPARSDPAR